MKAFIISQFSYFPLIWMLHSRILNNRINNIHERALGLTRVRIKSLYTPKFEDDLLWLQLSINIESIHKYGSLFREALENVRL